MAVALIFATRARIKILFFDMIFSLEKDPF
ncbi:pyridoxamine 5'-phosphate oxidase, partial [Wolbachia endosymbiont of Drosophila bocqueti]|nr:pyridoxamine 5'-phosphate oxidase [Wolbachia endosymbiont of Drosophila bocqueti]